MYKRWVHYFEILQIDLELKYNHINASNSLHPPNSKFFNKFLKKKNKKKKEKSLATDDGLLRLHHNVRQCRWSCPRFALGVLAQFVLEFVNSGGFDD